MIIFLPSLHLLQQLYRTHSTTPGSVSSSTSGGSGGGGGNGGGGSGNPNAAAANASAVALTMQQLQQQQQQMFAAANQQMLGEKLRITNGLDLTDLWRISGDYGLRSFRRQ